MYPDICLTTKEKPQLGHPKVVGLFSAKNDSFSRLGHSVVILTGLLTLAFTSGDGGQPSVSVGIPRVAELGVPQVS